MVQKCFAPKMKGLLEEGLNRGFTVLIVSLTFTLLIRVCF